MQNILLYVVLVPIYIFLWIAPITAIWWFFDVDAQERAWKKHESAVGAVYIISFIVLMVVLGEGIKELLIFIPNHWGGYDEDGDFVTARAYIGYFLGFIAALFFAHVFSSFEKLRAINRKLSVPTEIRTRKDGLRYCTREQLVQTRKQVSAELEKLRDRVPMENPMTSKEEDQIEILNSVFWEIDRLLRASGGDMGPDVNSKREKTTEPETTGMPV